MKKYFTISLRYYASDYYLKKWHTTNNSVSTFPKQHRERALNFIKFKWDLIEKITGKNMEFWFDKFSLDSNDLAILYTEIISGIIIQPAYEKFCRFYIPKSNKKIYDWCISYLDKIENPYNIIKRPGWICKYNEHSYGYDKVIKLINREIRKEKLDSLDV